MDGQHDHRGSSVADSSVQQAFETQAFALAHQHRHAPENDPGMVLARRLLFATALAGVVIFALPIILKVPADLPSRSMPVTITGSVPLKAKPPDVRLPKPQAPPPELLRGSLP